MPPPVPTARKMAGNSTPCAIYRGLPSELKVAMETLAVAFVAKRTLVKPVTVHTIPNRGGTGAAAVEKLKRSTPEVGMKKVDMVVFEGLTLEQFVEAAADFIAENCKPDIDMSLTEVEFSKGAAVNATAKATLGGGTTKRFSMYLQIDSAELPLSHASIRCTSSSDNLTLKTRTDCMAKSDPSGVC